MPDPDLVAWIDGEADAASAERLARAVAGDQALRREALALLRQRAQLATVLAEVRTQRPPLPRHIWWLGGAVVAAAAVLVAAIIITAVREAPPAPPLAQAPDPTPLPAAAILARLADGSAWSAGQRIEADRAVVGELAGGGRIELEAGAILVAPAAAGPWVLERGRLQAAAPAGGLRLETAHGGFDLEAGTAGLAVDGDGSAIEVRSGRAGISDRLTAATTTLAAPGRFWIPADATAPQAVEGAEGLTRGTVLAGPPGQLLLRTRFGTTAFMPRWVSRQEGFDPAMRQAIVRLHPGDRVEVDWWFNEHPRIRSLRLIAQDRAPAETPARPPPGF